MLIVCLNVLPHYGWDIAIIQFIAAIVLFLIVNWFGKHSIASYDYTFITIFTEEESAPAFNFIYRVVAPIVFFILYMALVPSLNFHRLSQNSYMVVVYYWVIRTIFRICTGRIKLTNLYTYFTCAIISVGLTYWIYSVTSEIKSILPNPHTLIDEMWILIILFFYNAFNKLSFPNNHARNKENLYIKSKYRKFKEKYNELIQSKCHNDFYEAVTYSIMIYEDFNRPKIVRLFEKIHFYITKKSHTLGIMQVRTNKMIDDKTSIILAIKIIKTATMTYKKDLKRNKYKEDTPNEATFEIAGFYNCYNYDYQCQINNIFDKLRSEYKNVDSHYKKIKAKNIKRSIDKTKTQLSSVENQPL